MSALLTRLQALERAVAALMAHTTGGETLQPTYLTVDAQGRVSAKFTGLVNALGLILPPGASFSAPSTPASEIIWQDSASGFIAARVYGYNDQTFTTQGVSVDAIPFNAASESVVQLEALDSTGVVQGRLTVAQESGGSSVNAEVSIPTINHPIAVILRDGGRSDFVQLQSLGSNNPHTSVMDDNAGSFYNVSASNQANGTSSTQTFVTVRPGWTAATPLGALRCVVHGTTTQIAVPWTVSFTGPNTWGIVVTNQSGFAIDWQWYGAVIGV